MYNSKLASPDDFDELEAMDEDLLEAFDAIDASALSHPTVSQCSAPTTDSDAVSSAKSQTILFNLRLKYQLTSILLYCSC
jgi:hypothetical protein